MAVTLAAALFVAATGFGSVASLAAGGAPGANALAVGGGFTCASLASGDLRCWGANSDGQLGYGTMEEIGDDEVPAVQDPVDLGAGGPAVSLALGDAHACAVLQSGEVRCWGRGAWGQLGYANTESIGDDEPPSAVGPVDLGPGRTATAIAAGSFHTCAILDTGDVRCWGNAHRGQLGYGDTVRIGDNETPGSVGPADLGPGRTATAITAGSDHTCAILDTGRVRCWGDGDFGQLGYGNEHNIGDDEAPGSVGPVHLGPGRTATAIAAGGFHTCAVLDTGAVRCWGPGLAGRLGYGNTESIGDDETPAAAGPVDLGAGRTAASVETGFSHTCAVLDTGDLRCWGDGSFGELGYADVRDIGDDETPDSVGPIDLGPGRTATTVAGGGFHTCAILDTGRIRCWGLGEGGRLGYGDTRDIGDDETPAAAGPVILAPPVPTELSLRATPKRDETKRYRFRATGTLSGLFVGTDDVCEGRVRLLLKKGTATRDRAKAKLRPRGGEGCGYAAKLETEREGRLKLKAAFPGNSKLDRDTARVRVRAG